MELYIIIIINFKVVSIVDVLIKELKSNSCKITPQRIAVYQTIKDSVDHPNAEAVFKKLYPAYPTMSLATVYKSLELFSKLGLVQVINIGENSFRYDGRIEDHQHIICTHCSKIEDLNNSIFEDLPSKVADTSNYHINKQQLCFYGICSDCLKEASSN